MSRALAFVSIVALTVGAARAAALRQGKVVSVHDGDTITVRLSSGTEKVRLIGIDTPELYDARPEYREAAYAARDHARSQLKGRTITLESDELTDDRDAYARLLRYVILGDGTNFNEALVRAGYARVFDRFKFTMKARFKVAEAEAKREVLGLWRLPPGPARVVPHAKR